MLLTVLVLSAVFLSATVIAGLLMVYQLGQITKVADSAEAIFAADAALERALFKVFRCNPPNPSPFPMDADPICANAALQVPPTAPTSDASFYNGATYQMTIFQSTDPTNPCSGAHTDTALPADVTCIRATGRAGKVARAFEIIF